MTPEDFELWKQMPQTAEKMAQLEAEVEQLKEHLATGKTISGDSYAATAINTCLAVGQIQGLRSLMTVELEEGKED